MSIEDRIGMLRQQQVETPLGWLICYENRPLQGIPPKGSGPHLLFFSGQEKAQAFISSRQKFYGIEPLSLLAVDSADSLKELASLPSSDPRYAAPPCGVVFDFDYSTARARKILAASEFQRMLPVEIARASGSSGASSPVPTAGIQQPPNAGQVAAPPARKRSLSKLLITCGSILAVILLLVCLGGIWFGVDRGMIPIPDFLFTSTSTFTPTPTFTSTPTLTSTPTRTPTQVPTLSPTPPVWNVDVQDDFSTNTNDWPLSNGNPGGDCGSDSLVMQSNSLIWAIAGGGSCNWWNYPDLPALTDFDLSIDVSRQGTPGNAAGLIFRLVEYGAQSYYIFLVDDANHTYHIAENNQGNWKTYADWNYSSAILPGAENHIEVSARGSQFTFFINGVKVTSITSTAVAAGKVGILASVYNNGDLDTIIFKNFSLQGVSK